MHPTVASIASAGPEAVLTAPQWDTIQQAARSRDNETVRLHPDDIEQLVRALLLVLAQMPAPVIDVQEITDKQRRHVRALG